MNITSIFPALIIKTVRYAGRLPVSATKTGPGRKCIHHLDLSKYPPNPHTGRKESGRFGKGIRAMITRNQLALVQAKRKAQVKKLTNRLDLG